MPCQPIVIEAFILVNPAEEMAFLYNHCRIIDKLRNFLTGLHVPVVVHINQLSIYTQRTIPSRTLDSFLMDFEEFFWEFSGNPYPSRNVFVFSSVYFSIKLQLEPRRITKTTWFGPIRTKWTSLDRVSRKIRKKIRQHKNHLSQPFVLACFLSFQIEYSSKEMITVIQQGVSNSLSGILTFTYINTEPYIHATYFANPSAMFPIDPACWEI